MDSIIPRLVNLQELRVNLRMKSFDDVCLFLIAVSRLKNLTRVELEMGMTRMHPEYKDILVEGMNNLCGIHAKLLHVLEVGGIYFWKSPPKSTLTWSMDLEQHIKPKMNDAKTIARDWCRVTVARVLNAHAWDEDGTKWYIGTGSVSLLVFRIGFRVRESTQLQRKWVL